MLADLRALERMLDEGLFETGVRRIGAEQEMFLIDDDLAPGAAASLKMLEQLQATRHYTTELGQFQLEANCDPQVLRRRRPLARCTTQLDELVEQARARGRRARACDVVLMGILPTMRKTDLGLDNMVPSPRYMQLNKIDHRAARRRRSSSRSRGSTS